MLTVIEAAAAVLVWQRLLTSTATYPFLVIPSHTYRATLSLRIVVHPVIIPSSSSLSSIVISLTSSHGTFNHSVWKVARQTRCLSIVMECSSDAYGGVDSDSADGRHEDEDGDAYGCCSWHGEYDLLCVSMISR